MRRDGRRYLLLEAICRVFFPSLSVDLFVGCVEKALGMTAVELTEDERLHFVKFYRLPADCLRCRKLVSIDDCERIFPQIEYSFAGLMPGTPNGVPVSNTSGGVTVGTISVNKKTTKSASRTRSKVCGDMIVIDDD